MKRFLLPALGFILALTAGGCRHCPTPVDEVRIFPPYDTALVLPCNIAPLNFSLSPGRYQVNVLLCDSTGIAFDSIIFKTRSKVIFKTDLWRDALTRTSARKGFLQIGLRADGTLFKSFRWEISPDRIDPYLIYRSGPHDDNPGGRLQVCQRSLESFTENILMDNALTGNNCMNCHTVGANNASRMVVHIRNAHAGTLILNGDEAVKISVPGSYNFRLSYPAWNPVYGYVAMATTVISPQGYINPHRTQDLMLDKSGKIVFYDVEKHRIFSDAPLSDSMYTYTFPAWSPDGKTLYFCRTRALNPDDLPPAERKRALAQFQYDLFSAVFRPESGSFDSIRLVYAFSSLNMSASMPCVNPAFPHYLLVSGMMMGSFSSQDQGNLYVLDVPSVAGLPDSARLLSAPGLTSADADRCGVWSSNGHWLVFGSKRENGAYSLLYLAHFDPDAPQGKEVSQPFVLPQKSPDYYRNNSRMFIFPVLSTESSALNPQRYRQLVGGEAQTPDLSYFKKYPEQTLMESGH